MQVEVRQPFYAPRVFDIPDKWVGVSSRRERVQALEIQDAHSEEAQVQLQRAKSEFQQLADTAAFHLWRQALLRQELIQAASGPTVIRALLPNERPARPRTEV